MVDYCTNKSSQVLRSNFWSKQLHGSTCNSSIVTKAGERFRVLAWLIRLTFQKRRMFKSTVMYEWPIWGNIVTNQKYRKMIDSTQRKAPIRLQNNIHINGRSDCRNPFYGSGNNNVKKRNQQTGGDHSLQEQWQQRWEDG